jgi:hypothetical protein
MDARDIRIHHNIHIVAGCCHHSTASCMDLIQFRRKLSLTH